jgi:D-glycero-D-manno-heptose 1,7-bisphosphate phosphatase
LNKAFFFDRDGILNRVCWRDGKAASPRTLAEFELLPGAAELVRGVRQLGFLALVATNQPDLDRALMPVSEMAAMHALLAQQVGFDGLAFCGSGDDADPRRKPNPGLLLELAEKHRVDLSESFFLGDGVKDILAGQRAGVTTILLKTHYNREHHDGAHYAFDSLEEVLEWIRTRDEQG